MESRFINETIEVILYCHNLKMEVIKFKWKGNIFKVTKTLRTWKIPEGNTFISHFVVKCEEQDLLCELSFRYDNFKWEIIQHSSLT